MDISILPIFMFCIGPPPTIMPFIMATMPAALPKPRSRVQSSMPVTVQTRLGVSIGMFFMDSFMCGLGA